MKNKLAFSELSVESRTEAIKEAAEESAWAIEKTEEKIARLADLLKQQKAALGHGKWLPWVRETFGDTDAAVWRVQSWLRAGRSNNCKINYLEVGECGDSYSAKTATRSERISDRVEVVESTVVPDNDPSPDPPSQRKTAKGSEKASEDKKPRTRPIIPEIVEDSPRCMTESDPVTEWIERHSLSEIVGRIIEKIEDEKARKHAARQLRKLADKLDPPTKFTRPDQDEVSAYFRELGAADPESFFDFYESKGWMVGKVSMKDWRASARKWVRENRDNPFGGKSNGNGHSNRNRELSAEDVFSAEAMARGRKHN